MPVKSYYSLKVCAEMLGVERHHLDSGVRAKKIKTRVPEGKRRKIYHLGDCRDWLNRPGKRTFTRRQTDETLSYQEAGEVVGISAASMEQYASRRDIDMTPESVAAYAEEHNAGVAHLREAPQGPGRRKATGELLEEQLLKLRAQREKEQANARIAQRKDEFEAGDVCRSTEMRRHGARIATAVVASQQRLAMTLPIAMSRHFDVHVVGQPDIVAKLEAALRSETARCVQEARRELSASLRAGEGTPAIERMFERLAEWLDSYSEVTP